jgi:hypothetical protein
MLIANTSAQLNDLLILTAIMIQLQGSDAVLDLETNMNKCGYISDDEIVSVVDVKLIITAETAPLLVVKFTYHNDVDQVDTGTFYMSVNDGTLSGDH